MTAVLLVVAGGSLIAFGAMTGDDMQLWLGFAFVLGAPLPAVISRAVLAKAVYDVERDQERYRRIQRGQLVAAWMATTIAALMVIAGLVLLFISTAAGAIVTGIGALYLAYRLYVLRDLYVH